MTTTSQPTLGFGMQLPIQSRSKLYREPWEDGAGRDELAAIAQAADRAGFAYIAVCDHVAIPRDRAETMQTAWYDTVATLGWLAALTTNVRLLSHVFIPAYRHPLVTAKSFMTLDHLSGGRAILGVGAGHVEAEFEVLGVPFAERGRITDDAVDVIRAALDDEFPDVDTDRWSVHDVGLSPRPTQAHVPIWVGGSSRPALRRAAERGDGWLPQGPPPEGMESAIEISPRATGRDRTNPALRHRRLCHAPVHRHPRMGPRAPRRVGIARSTGRAAPPVGIGGCLPPTGSPAEPQRRRAGRPDRSIRGRGHPADPVRESGEATAGRQAPESPCRLTVSAAQ